MSLQNQVDPTLLKNGLPGGLLTDARPMESAASKWLMECDDDRTGKRHGDRSTHIGELLDAGWTVCVEHDDERRPSPEPIPARSGSEDVGRRCPTEIVIAPGRPPRDLRRDETGLRAKVVLLGCLAIRSVEVVAGREDELRRLSATALAHSLGDRLLRRRPEPPVAHHLEVCCCAGRGVHRQVEHRRQAERERPKRANGDPCLRRSPAGVLPREREVGRAPRQLQPGRQLGLVPPVPAREFPSQWRGLTRPRRRDFGLGGEQPRRSPRLPRRSAPRSTSV